jgi:hypothetical protein
MRRKTMSEKHNKQLGQIIAKCWADESFKQKLIADPKAVLRAEGVDVPAANVRIVENSSELFHLVLPSKPAEGELSEDALDGVAGGTGGLYACSL